MLFVLAPILRSLHVYLVYTVATESLSPFLLSGLNVYSPLSHSDLR